MAKRSAGLLIYRFRHEGVEFLLVHPGGPFWAKKDDGAWSIPKGEFGDGEAPEAAAAREFDEEIGHRPSPGRPPCRSGRLRQSGGKVVVWGSRSTGNLDVSVIREHEFEMEWPPKSGRLVSFPEVDRAEWFPLDLARAEILKGQRGFLDALERLFHQEA